MANFTSPGAAASSALYQYLLQKDLEKRRAQQDALLLDDRMRQRAREDMQAQRQAEQDRIAKADRLAVIHGPASNLDPQTATTLREAGYRVDDPTLAARTMNVDAGGVTIGSQDLPSVTRRAETFTEAQARDQRERQQREEAAREATRLRERREDQERADLARRDGDAQEYLRNERTIVENDKDRAAAERRARISASGGSADRPTQGMLTADTFYSRALDASEILDEVEDNVSQFNAYVPNFLLSEDGQAYQQAQRQWTEAYLRKDSGAAIGKDEYANAAKAYFVAPGDSAATVKRKRRAREKMQDSLRLQGSGGSGGNGGGNEPRLMPSHGSTRKPTAAELIKKYGGG